MIQTQELDPLFIENSNLYVFSKDGFSDQGQRITGATRMFEVDPFEAVDIDEEADFLVASALERSDVG